MLGKKRFKAALCVKIRLTPCEAENSLWDTIHPLTRVSISYSKFGEHCSVFDKVGQRNQMRHQLPESKLEAENVSGTVQVPSRDVLQW